jgi:hypothetical protein
MAFEELQPVVLIHDIPNFDLRAGEIGTIVFVSQDGQHFEVEFVLPAGRTKALATLTPQDLRAMTEKDALTVRVS